MNDGLLWRNRYDSRSKNTCNVMTFEIQARWLKNEKRHDQHRIAHENDTQREIRTSPEEEVKTNRAKEIQALENKRRK